MANLSFVDAINDFRRKSVLAGRPAEKAAMDRSLRENAIRRLTTTRDRVAPMTPAIAEVVHGGGGMEPPLDTAPGSEGVPGGISGVQAGLISKGMADVLEGIPATIAGFEKGEKGGYIPTIKGLLSTPFTLTKPTIPLLSQLARGLTGQDASQGISSVAQLGQELGQEASALADPDSAISGITGVTEGDVAATVDAADLGLSSGGGGESPTVLCTELYRQGLIPLEIYIADSRYGSKLAPETLAGYTLWAEPLARAMSQSRALTSIVEPFVKAWAGEMAYREGILSKGNWLGKVLSFIGEPVCGFIGRSLNYGTQSNIY